MTPARALWALIVASALLRLAWAASLGPGNDEAYHYLFAVHTDWGYIDHPPMTAAVEAVGLMLAGGHRSAFALRLGFVALFAASTWLMARFTARHFSERAGFLAALALNAAPYYAAAVGAFALPDGPFLFFWLLTVAALARAIESPGDLAPWAGVGLAWGGAMLSKYLAVFLPAGVLLFFGCVPEARRCLRSPGPYLAFALGLLLFSPVLWWNLRHDWASFAFQGGRAVGGGRFRPDTMLTAALGQALYLSPWIWASLIAVLLGRRRDFFGGRGRPVERLLLWQAVIPLALFAAVSCTRPVLPHWSLVGLLPLFPLLGASWEQSLDSRPRRTRRRLMLYAAMPVVLAALSAVQARTGVVGIDRDPTADFYGWDQVASELDRRGLADTGAFFFTSRWYHSAQLSFAIRDAATVLCYNAHHAQGFAYWDRPEDAVGRDGIFVGVNDCDAEVAYFARWFGRVEPLSEFPILRGGRPVRRIHLYRFVGQTRPFPFGNQGAGSRGVVPPGEPSARPAMAPAKESNPGPLPRADAVAADRTRIRPV